MLAVALLGVLLPAPLAQARAPAVQPASESASTRYQVTFAARACPSYAEVMANRVRDDRIEAASAPGRASAYRDGQAVDPNVEAANSAGCTPLPDWRFTLGSAQEKKGPLSTIKASAGDVAPTAATAPQLDPTGKPTGSTLAGAVTFLLGDDQVRLATRRQLWAQGGTPADPLLAKTQPGYGFGAMRCGLDGRAGGNVQWIGFPAGVRHVFCFAYYVRSAAPTATLIVRAKTTRPVGYAQRFSFDVSLSYTAQKRLDLASSGQPVDFGFVRTAAGEANRVVARTPAQWLLADLTCGKSGAGASTVTVDRQGGRAEVALAGGEVVTCTYVFEPPPAGAGLTLRVSSEGGDGAFGLAVNGEGGTRALQAAPKGDGSAVVATGADLGALLPGQYTVTVTPPAPESTLWSLAGFACNGSQVDRAGLTATVTLSVGVSLDCALQMVRRGGAIDLNVVTVGGVGSAALVVVPIAEGVPGWSQVATTTGAGQPATAAGEVPAGLPFGSYLVTPLAPQSTVEGSWRLSSFSCDPGQSMDMPNVAADVVELAAGTARAKCTATYLFETSTRLQVTVRFAGETAGRAGDIALDVSCADGSNGRVVLPADDFTERSLPQPLGFLEATNCTVGRPELAATDKATTSVTASLEPAPGNAPLSLPGTISVSREVNQYTVLVTATFSATDEAPNEAKILNSFRVLPVALAGAGLVGVGLVILLVMVVRSRRA